MWCREPPKGRWAHLNKSNMVPTTLKRLKRHIPSLSDLPCFPIMPIHLKKLLSFLPPQSLTLSVLQLVTEERPVMSLHWGYWCHLHSILSASRLNLSLLLPTLCLALLLQLAQHFLFPGSMIMSALIFKCVCPSVLTPAHCQGQAQNGTGIGSQCQGTKQALMACHADFKTVGEPCTWKPESEFKKWQ